MRTIVICVVGMIGGFFGTMLVHWLYSRLNKIQKTIEDFQLRIEDNFSSVFANISTYSANLKNKEPSIIPHLCKRCGSIDDVGYTTLVGGIRTKLCSKCGIEWDEFAYKQSELDNLSVVQARIKAMTTGAITLNIAKFNEVMTNEFVIERQLTLKLRDISKKWLAGQTTATPSEDNISKK